MRPDDLALLRLVRDPDVHPDGRRIAVAVGRPDLDDDTYVREIHLVTPDGSTRRFTHGPGDARPRWSPSGDRLAFLRSPAKGEPAQLAVAPADGGEAEVLTELPLGVGSHAWSPDGRWLVVTAAVRPEELADLEDDERDRRPRRVTELGFRGDSVGWLHDQRTHLWLVDATGEEEPRQLTDGPFDHAGPAFTADGTAVLCVSARHATRETDASAGVWRIPVDGGEPVEVVAPGSWTDPVPAPDGGVLVVGHVDAFSWPAPPALHHVPEDGADPVDLLPDLDRDVAGPDGRPPVVLDDGSVLVTVEDRGAVHLLRVRDGDAEVLVGGAQAVLGAAADAGGTTIAYVATHPSDPGELWLLDGDEPRVLTNLNEELRGELLPTEHITIDHDGVELDGWLLLPDGDAGDDVPLLFNIHGGPTAQYGHMFFDEFQVYARAGYAVVGINPRGSSGRGSAWARAVVGVWEDEGSVDVRDLESVVDAVLARYPRVDGERVGIMGGSYGGYATARLLARTDRYRSAVVERGLLNWVSFGGTSDIGAFFDRMFVDSALPDDADRLWAASPVRTADRITTPTLVVHSFEDHRCPPEQAYQLFSVLRRNRVDSEMLLFPDESHELSRSGAPKHRVERFEAILDWHDAHLDHTRPTTDTDDADDDTPPTRAA